jgi:hypothetical protein
MNIQEQKLWLLLDSCLTNEYTRTKVMVASGFLPKKT